nr:hypothetical protein [Pandoravirus massiliensis]
MCLFFVAMKSVGPFPSRLAVPLFFSVLLVRGVFRLSASRNKSNVWLMWRCEVAPRNPANAVGPLYFFFLFRERRKGLAVPAAHWHVAYGWGRRKKVTTRKNARKKKGGPMYAPARDRPPLNCRDFVMPRLCALQSVNSQRGQKQVTKKSPRTPR